MPIPSSRSYIGIAKETTRGTAVTPTASIPLTSITAHDEITFIDDTGLRGSLVSLYDRTPGPTWSTWDATGHVFPDSIGFWLASILPDVATTGASNPYTHTFSVLNTGTGQPKGYTIADYSGLGATSGARYFPGAGVTELTFKFDAAGALTYDVKTLANSSSLVPTSAPTKTFGTLVPTPAYIATVTIGGSAVTTVQMGDLSIKRPITPIHSADGTQAPYSLFSGPVDVTGNLTFVAEDETELLRYLNVTKPSLDLNFAATVNTNTQVLLHCTSVVYAPADVIRTKDYAEIQVAYRAKANATDVGASAGYSPIKVTIQNANPSGTYA
jgi:hypothetical protein